MKTILTGFKPTGTFHLGNYLGALKPLEDIANSHPNDQILCLVADMHALNTHPDSKLLQTRSHEMLRLLVAFDPDSRFLIYRSSRIAEIGQCTQLIANHLGKGFLNRAHAYMVRRDENIAQNKTADEGINMGLYTYPLLMAADIICTGSDLVPVGPDQLQHLEIAQTLTRSLNSHKKAGLTVAETLVQMNEPLAGLDGRKMSKSYDNVIPLLGKNRTKAVKRIVTDSTPLGSPKDPDTCHIMNIYRHFADPAAYDALSERYRNGTFSYGAAKMELAEHLDQRFVLLERRYMELLDQDLYKRVEHDEMIVRERCQAILTKLYTALGL